MMHFSQLYRPDEVAAILDARVPPALRRAHHPVRAATRTGRAEPGRRRDTELTDQLDLHTFQPRECADVVEEYVRAAHDGRLPRVRIIHGKGTGTLRRIVHSVLEAHPPCRAPPGRRQLGRDDRRARDSLATTSTCTCHVHVNNRNR